MASKRYPKRIRHEQQLPNEKSVCRHSTRPSRPRVQQLFHLTDATTGHLTSAGGGVDFDSRLRANERIARHKFLKRLSALSCADLPRRLNHMIELSILPGLENLGFDKSVARTFFKLAPSSWKMMAPADANIVAFLPQIDREIEDVRQGLLIKAARRQGNRLGFSELMPASIPGTLNVDMSPKNLFDLLDEIATPWIILPRAFRFLKKHQCRYLPRYLRVLDRERREVSLKLFSRITVEFVGNYTLKFAGRRHQPDQLAELLFYGYSMLFWKNLRRPPENLENSAVFDSILRWLRRLSHISAFIGQPEIRNVEGMEDIISKIFPMETNHPSKPKDQAHRSRFTVTLRHGYLGIASVLKYFGMDQLFESRKIAQRDLAPSIAREMPHLLHTIQTHYQSESSNTQGYMRHLTGILKSARELIHSGQDRLEKELLNRRFNNLELLFGC